MEQTRFDRFTRRIAAGGSRRAVVKSLVGSALGAVGLTHLGRAGAASSPTLSALADLEPAEQAMVLYEALAELTEAHLGNCAELQAKTERFLQDHAGTLDQITTIERGWSHVERLANAEKYGDRLLAATKTLHFGKERCGYRGGDAATPAAQTFMAAALDLRPSVRQETCDCSADCPLSTGQCIYAWGACIAGGCMCCWTSYCGSHDHCMTDCDANECCTGNGVCQDPEPPDEG